MARPLAEGPPEVDGNLFDRGVLARPRYGLHRSQPPRAIGSHAVFRDDDRLRQDVAQDRQWHPGWRLRLGDPRGPGAARPALRRDRRRRIRQLRRWRELAVPAPQYAGRRRTRHEGEERRSDCRDPRARILDSGWPACAAGDHAGSRRIFRAPLHRALTYRLMGPGFDFSRLGSAGNHGPAFVRILEDGIALHQTRQADGSVEATYLNAGTNPPRGVVVTYYLKQKPNGPVTLTFMDSRGKTIQQFSGASPERFGPQVSAAPGTNQFVWDMTYPNAKQLSQADFAAEERGDARAAVAVPGTYKVR